MLRVVRNSLKAKSTFKLELLLFVLASFIFTGFFSGCTTAPKKTGLGSSLKTAPEWVFTPPQADDKYMYFTGSGTSKKGDPAEGEQIAKGEVLDEIMRYIGVRITSETTAVAKGSLNTFKTDITQTLTSKSSGRITGLEIADRWIEKKDSSVTVYVLARYNKNEIIKEKKRLEKLFKEKIEAVSIPEKEGDRLKQQGSYYKAVIKYLEASGAAFKSDIENADIKFERTINKAKDSLSNITLIKLNDNLSGFAGRPLPEPFKVKVVAGSTKESSGIPNVSIRVSYTELSKSGRKRVKTVIIKTDSKGYASFIYPVPQFVGSADVSMMLDINPYLASLENVPDKLQDMVNGLYGIALKKKVVFKFTIASLARKIPMGVVVADLDASGKPIDEAETENGLLDVLTGANFNVTQIPVDKWKILGKNDKDIISLIRSASGNKVKRIVYGYGKISGYEQDKQTVIVKVTGFVKVVDINSKEILLSVDKTKSALGSNVSAALSAAFHKLGEDLGKEVADKLR